ncbi:MAG: ArsB/NhaD family transporter [Alphaproteobacteria bacterium]|nr:ArsB/NhaD family transporter [Alphaproteobacteria bacterium]
MPHEEPLSPILGLDPLWIATGILILTYALIMTERVNRAILALIGGGLMVTLGILNQEEAVRGIDFNTLALLIGMMVLVSVTKKCGVFQYVAIVTAQLVKASPAAVMALLAIVTAVFSAFLDNVTTVLLVAPVTLVVCRQLQVNPYPFLFTQIFASNIGGTATLIGDPPNILIGSLVGISFNAFVVNLAPIIFVILAVQIAMGHLLWGIRLKATPEARASVMALNAKESITDSLLMKQALGVLALVILCFVMARQLHLEPGTIALGGATLLLLLDNLDHAIDHQHHRVTEAFNEVEWVTIFFFVGLFVLIAGVERAGLLSLLAEKLLAATHGDMKVTAVAILWASAVLSAIIDNIPFVATMVPLIKNLQGALGGPEAIMPLWWALSLGACLGGNGTLIGASANLTVAGIATREGVEFRFVKFLLVAFPMMLVSVAIAHAYVMWRYFGGF